MKKILLTLYIIFFTVACLLPTFIMIVAPNDISYYGEQYLQLPKLVDSGGFNVQFPMEFESYFSNNFGMRQLLISLYAAIQYQIGSSGNRKVIVGKDGWLFLNRTLDDYIGRETLSPVELFRLYKILDLQYQYLTGKGISFVLAIAPNKNSIYEEYMPNRYKRLSDVNNLKLITEYLYDKNIPYVDLLRDLKKAKAEHLIYHKKDTHWNNYGALIAYRSIMKKIMEQNPGFKYEDYTSTSYELTQNWEGDLDAMLMPYFDLKDNQVAFDIRKNYTYLYPIRSLLDINITSQSEVNDFRLLMFRDSFGNALIPFLSNTFGYVHYTREVPYDHSLVDKENPQVVILEVAERNISSFLESAPILPAPKVNHIPSYIEENEEIRSEIYIENNEDCFKIYGWASLEEYIGEELEIYIGLLNESNNYCFEPFPILEEVFQEKLVAEPYLKDAGFTMIIDKKDLTQGVYYVNIIIKKERAYFSSMTEKKLKICN